MPIHKLLFRFVSLIVRKIEKITTVKPVIFLSILKLYLNSFTHFYFKIRSNRQIPGIEKFVNI